MKTSPPLTPTKELSGRLLRVLGVGFGLAVIIGNTIGAGIFRTPGDIAAHLQNPWLFLGVWIIGGLYALLGAVALAELGTMLPRAGGQYVYSRYALGEYAGFIVGWSDWISTCGSAAAVSLVIGEFAGKLIPSLNGRDVVTAVFVALVFADTPMARRELGQSHTKHHESSKSNCIPGVDCRSVYRGKRWRFHNCIDYGSTGRPGSNRRPGAGAAIRRLYTTTVGVVSSISRKKLKTRHAAFLDPYLAG